ncbi:hypothetical protein BYT27DRAFT_7088965 [Phlegmacium glaucopus]|nr:hypothetical protein BYT27DRAFT_7088965 [Phlegmacium glaucopus]
MLHALPAYNPILVTAIDLLIDSKIQMRVFHIPQNENNVADTLSLVITKFSPPHFTLGETRL